MQLSSRVMRLVHQYMYYTPRRSEGQTRTLCDFSEHSTASNDMRMLKIETSSKYNLCETDFGQCAISLVMFTL